MVRLITMPKMFIESKFFVSNFYHWSKFLFPNFHVDTFSRASIESSVVFLVRRPLETLSCISESFQHHVNYTKFSLNQALFIWTKYAIIFPIHYIFCWDRMIHLSVYKFLVKPRENMIKYDMPDVGNDLLYQGIGHEIVVPVEKKRSGANTAMSAYDLVIGGFNISK